MDNPEGIAGFDQMPEDERRAEFWEVIHLRIEEISERRGKPFTILQRDHEFAENNGEFGYIVAVSLDGEECVLLSTGVGNKEDTYNVVPVEGTVLRSKFGLRQERIESRRAFFGGVALAAITAAEMYMGWGKNPPMRRGR